MKRTLLAAVMALVVHALLWRIDLSWLAPKKPMLSRPHLIMVTLSTLRPEKPEPKPIVQKQPPIPEKIPPVVEPKAVPLKPATPLKQKPEPITPKKTPLKKPVTQKKESLPPKPSEPAEKRRPTETDKVRSPERLPVPVMEPTRDRKSQDRSASPDISPRDEKIRMPIEVKPVYRSNPPPTYPRMARRKKYQGLVVLDVLVNQNGSVDDIRILRSSGHSILDNAAVNAVKEWVFEPGKRDGIAVDMRVTIPVHFRLK